MAWAGVAWAHPTVSAEIQVPWEQSGQVAECHFMRTLGAIAASSSLESRRTSSLAGKATKMVSRRTIVAGISTPIAYTSFAWPQQAAVSHNTIEADHIQ